MSEWLEVRIEFSDITGTAGAVRRRDLIGGLIHGYELAA
jgi:hypothetical protein